MARLTCIDLLKLKKGVLLAPEKLAQLMSYAHYLNACSKVARAVAVAYVGAGQRIFDVWELADILGSESDCLPVSEGKVIVYSPVLAESLFTALLKKRCWQSEPKQPPQELENCIRRVFKVRRTQHGEKDRERLRELPQCVSHMLELLKQGELSHQGRVYLATALLWHCQLVQERPISECVDRVLEVLRENSPPDKFKEKLARYQVEHLAGMRGSGKRYWPPKCATVIEAGLCPLQDEERGKCKWLNKLIGLIKKESRD